MSPEPGTIDYILFPTSLSECKVIVWVSKLHIMYAWPFIFSHGACLLHFLRGTNLLAEILTKKGQNLSYKNLDVTGPTFGRASHRFLAITTAIPLTSNLLR